MLTMRGWWGDRWMGGGIGGSFGKSNHFGAQFATGTCKNSSKIEFQFGQTVAIRVAFDLF